MHETVVNIEMIVTCAWLVGRSQPKQVLRRVSLKVKQYDQANVFFSFIRKKTTLFPTSAV